LLDKHCLEPGFLVDFRGYELKHLSECFLTHRCNSLWILQFLFYRVDQEVKELSVVFIELNGSLKLFERKIVDFLGDVNFVGHCNLLKPFDVNTKDLPQRPKCIYDVIRLAVAHFVFKDSNETIKELWLELFEASKNVH
jgi:hypothetical protein